MVKVWVLHLRQGGQMERDIRKYHQLEGLRKSYQSFSCNGTGTGKTRTVGTVFPGLEKD